MDQKEERYLKTLILHLEDISNSLKIISGRVDNKEPEPKKDSYASKYFAQSKD